MHPKYPFAGSRILKGLLKAEGRQVRRRHVPTLMRRIAIATLFRRPNTSKPAPGHKTYPYLPRNLAVSRPNRVWAMNIGLPHRVTLLNCYCLVGLWSVGVKLSGKGSRYPRALCGRTVL